MLIIHDLLSKVNHFCFVFVNIHDFIIKFTQNYQFVVVYYAIKNEP